MNANLKGSGTYRRCFYFSRELARRGHQVTMFTVSRDSLYRPRQYYKAEWIGEQAAANGEPGWVRIIEGPGVGYRWIPGWGSGPLDIYARIRELVMGEYQAVWGFEHHPNVSWPIYLTKRFRGYRFYSDWCDWFAGNANRFRGYKWAHRIDGVLEERIRFAAEMVSVTSILLKERALAIGIPPERVVHIPEGAAVDYIVPLDADESRERMRVPAGRPLVAAVRAGDMCREVRVFNEVLRRVPDALFLMIGHVPPPALELAERFGIRDRLILVGWVSDEDYPRYLACADVCFCPLEDGTNDRARWPAKILDYLAAGRATVTNDVGEAGTLFRHREVGVVAGPTGEEMADCIVGLLRDSDRSRFLGENARRVVVKEWDWRVRGSQIASVVEG